MDERMTAMQYAESLIDSKEQGKAIFDEEQRNLIINFASMAFFQNLRAEHI